MKNFTGTTAMSFHTGLSIPRRSKIVKFWVKLEDSARTQFIFSTRNMHNGRTIAFVLYPYGNVSVMLANDWTDLDIDNIVANLSTKNIEDGCARQIKFDDPHVLGMRAKLFVDVNLAGRMPLDKLKTGQGGSMRIGQDPDYGSYPAYAYSGCLSAISIHDMAAGKETLYLQDNSVSGMREATK